MQFQPGQSGNPAGRPRGARNKRTVLLENLLDGEAEAIARKAIELAKNGEMAAIRLCMNRLLPPSKGDPVNCELPPLLKPADSVTAMSAIVAATAAGELTPAEAADLCKIVDTYLRAIETHDIEERLCELERRVQPDRQAWTPSSPFFAEEYKPREPEGPSGTE